MKRSSWASAWDAFPKLTVRGGRALRPPPVPAASGQLCQLLCSCTVRAKPRPPTHPQDDFSKKTRTGATITIASSIIALLLFCNEIRGCCCVLGRAWGEGGASLQPSACIQ